MTHQSSPTPRRTFRETDRIWAVFVNQCFADNTTASEVIREGIEQYLKDKGWDVVTMRSLDAQDLGRKVAPAPSRNRRINLRKEGVK